MSFAGYNGVLRKVGREIVLPSRKIKNIINRLFLNNDIHFCVDFGAGTLYWAEYLFSKCYLTYAVDIIYSNNTNINGICCYNDINNLLVDETNGLFFLCDVLHHLDESFENDLFDRVLNSKQYNVIVIKDIDSTKIIGNFFNKVHDKLINGEDIRDINPQSLSIMLQNHGYTCQIEHIRKLWYPHFIITATL